ncbi:MAG: hypothetical protein OIF57_05300 [Marinobacterium sp.]|nr:hypothetical protein [Marinobacterium sp.]
MQHQWIISYTPQHTLLVYGNITPSPATIIYQHNHRLRLPLAPFSLYRTTTAQEYPQQQ